MVWRQLAGVSGEDARRSDILGRAAEEVDEQCPGPVALLRRGALVDVHRPGGGVRHAGGARCAVREL